jgi:hypothetical protein
MILIKEIYYLDNSVFHKIPLLFPYLKKREDFLQINWFSQTEYLTYRLE